MTGHRQIKQRILTAIRQELRSKNLTFNHACALYFIRSRVKARIK